ncbi:MAG: M20 family metallopeptidase [Candidatus Hydrogenedentes bacterium]|nr:M20 family metallopeptidase [Candidatus Hydrogenedentota bacterium]
MAFEATIREVLPELRLLRRELHAHPEIRYEERWTSDRIAAFLDGIGVPYTRGHAKGTGIVATLRGHGPDTVALRSDMDALELDEVTGLPHASLVPHRMHACGHDGHMACLCGVAKVLALHKDELRGSVKFIFQPAEEREGGGRLMVEEGVLDGVKAAFAQHSWPEIPVGSFAVRDGAIMASADWFRIDVVGKGCHGAHPDEGVDSLVVAAHITTALQTIVSREVAPTDAAVVTVGRIIGGVAQNIIPETAFLEGTFRAFKASVRDTIQRAIERIATGVASAFRAEARATFGDSYPVLVNNRAMTDLARTSIRETLGPDALIEADRPSMGAEDFAYYLQRVPGAMIWLGVGRLGQSNAPLHSPHFDFNDDAIEPAIRVLSDIVMRVLQA